MKQTIRIILVDDHDLVRESWKLLLSRHPGFYIIGDHSKGQAAIEQVLETRPDILLVDINMTPTNGFEVTEKVVSLSPATRVIAISVNNQPRYANRIFELGGSGYITKTSSMQEIHFGIKEVFEGRKYICEEVKKSMTSAELKNAEGNCN
jgi:DNA-binding NarL/FixJ family response regulator